MLKRFALVPITTLAISVATFNNQAINDQPSSLDFGKVSTGAAWKDLPSNVSRTDSCAIDDNGNADCEFLSDEGIYYLADGTEIVRKEMRRNGANFGGTLPFGLSGAELTVEVSRLMRVNYAITMEETDLGPSRNGQLYLSSGPISTNGSHLKFHLYFLFSHENTLLVVGTTLGSTPED